MYSPEPDVYFLAALGATEAASRCDFSEDVLRESINLAYTNETRQSEHRLAADVRTRLGNARIFSTLSHIYDAIPKSVTDSNDYLAQYRESFRKLVDTVRKDLANEAIEWARNHLENEADDSASICATDPAADWMSSGIDMLVFGASVVGRKKLDNREARYFNRLASKMPKIAKEIQANGVEHDMDACVLIATKELFNGLRPLMFFALAMMYGQYILLGLLMSVGASPFILEAVADKTLTDDSDFSDSVLAHSSILQALGPYGRVLAYDDFDSACTAAEITQPHLEAVLQMADKFKTQLDAHNRQVRQWELREKELSRTIDRQAKSIKDLQENKDSDAIRSLMDELAAARSDVAKLRGQLSIKDEKLAKLGATEISPAAAKPPVAASIPAKAVAPARVQEMSPDDALEYLRDLKCVLVGGHTIFHSKISQALPNWTLYDADHTLVDDAHIRAADLVVFFTSHASHTQTKGVLKKTRQFNVPVAYAYKVNPQAFYVEVAQQAKRVVNLNSLPTA